MSSKAICKVQEDIKNLKQLLSVSASGLQRQALGIDKLKLETAQVKAVTGGITHMHRSKSDFLQITCCILFLFIR